MLMIPAIPLLAFFKVSIRSILTHIPQTHNLTSTTLSVTRVPAHMMQVSSTVHTFLSKWFVPLVRTPSSLRSALRPVTVSLQTHLLKVLIRVLEDSVLTATVTTEELQLKTSCNFQLSITEFIGGFEKTLFFYK